MNGTMTETAIPNPQPLTKANEDMPSLVSGLRQLYGESPHNGLLFGALLKGQIDRPVLEVSTVLNLLQDKGIERRNVVEWMNAMQKLGLGRFWAGRRGHESRFEWAYSPLEIASYAEGTENLSTQKRPRRVYSSKVKVAQESSGSLSFYFPEGKIEVPANISKEEAQKFLKKIQSVLLAALN